jgi:hypothetical protein
LYSVPFCAIEKGLGLPALTSIREVQRTMLG